MYLKAALFGALFAYSSFALSTPLALSGRSIHDSTSEDINTRSGAKCAQVQCQVTVCATDGMDALKVASNGIQFLMGQDCAGWQSGPNNIGQEACASGLYGFTGEITIWRAWVVDPHYSGTFAQWGNFIGATCSGVRAVSCSSKTGYAPNAFNGECYQSRYF
jgi:hypothetical protein